MLEHWGTSSLVQKVLNVSALHITMIHTSSLLKRKVWVNQLMNQINPCPVSHHHPLRDDVPAQLHHRQRVIKLTWVKVCCRLSQHMQAINTWNYKGRFQLHFIQCKQRLLPLHQQVPVSASDPKLEIQASAFSKQLSGMWWWTKSNIPKGEFFA